MSMIQMMKRRCLKWTFFPKRCYRTFGKRGSTKTAVAVTLILLAFIATVQRQKRNVVKRDVPQVLNEAADKLQSPVRNIQEYVINNEAHDVKRNKNITKCPRFPSALVGSMKVNQNITPNFKEVENVSGHHLIKGGCYKPRSCIPRQKVAILIPFKDREAHLKTLLFFLHPMLQKQKAHYCIYVAEQFDNGTFNKAMIMNAAFEEAMKLDTYDCVVFHDVDMIPENDKNLYTCAKHPRHLSPSIDKFEYKPHYGTDFGGVTAITPAQYRKANGHSNEFWGWGGEDNDMEFRIRFNGMKILAAPLNHGRYKMIVHKHPWKFTRGNDAYKLNKTREGRAKVDGLSDLIYRMTGVERFSTYTKLMIDIRKIEVKAINMFIDGKPAMSVDVTSEKCRWQEYPGKYLDFNIDLSEHPEAAHLKVLRVNQPPPQPKLPKIPEHIQEEMPVSPTPARHFSLVDSKEEAMRLCDQLAPECQGVQREGSSTRYSLRRRNIPRNIVITGSSDPHKNSKVGEKINKKYYFPDKSAFIKYCPGASGGSIQGYMHTLDVDLNLDQNKLQHTYSFEVYFHLSTGIPCRWIELPGLTLAGHMRKSFYENTYLSLTHAKNICAELGVHCGGVVKERNKEEYSIHPRGSPRNDEGFLRNMVIENGNIPPGGLGTDFVSSGLTKSVIFGDGRTPLKPDLPSEDGAKRTTYIRYCPASGGTFQMVAAPIKIDFDKDIASWVKENNKKNYKHFYKFEIDFKVILQPTKYLYYADTKQFEGQMNKGQNFYTFRWPGSKAPDFRLPNTPREFKFRTEDFAVPNIPGCYTIRSRILDRLQHPYYEWNWWFEVKSDDRTKDAMAREEFWRRQMHANIIESKVSSVEKEAEEKRKEQEKKEYLFKKEMAEIRHETFVPDPAMEAKLKEKKMESGLDDKELDAKSKIIEVHDPKKGYPKIKNIAPKPVVKPAAVRDKVFHAALPKHLKSDNSKASKS